MKRFLLASTVVLVACAGAPEPVLVPPPTTSAVASAAPPSSAPDPLAERPPVSEPGPYVPETPEAFDGPSGSKVWLLERHNLPLVAVTAIVPVGAAAEPIDKAGLSFVTADMLDEGAGKRDALAFSAAIEDLGASLSSASDRDESRVSLHVLASHLDDALGLLGDAIVRPRHDPKDFARVSALWRNAVKQRGDDPNAVARLVTSAAFFGDATAYGHPVEGTVASSAKVRLADVERWHRAVWRPDRTTFVVVGDVTKARATELLAKAFSGWAPPKETAPETPPPSTKETRPKTVVVDRPDAPQVVMSIVRAGVVAESPERPRLELLNVALGGSFTSRLNQNLREAHGWTYGARSRFAAERKVGTFVARAAIRTDAIEPALKETLREIGGMAREGLSQEELVKVRALVRADTIETYGNVGAIASSLGQDAALGLPPDTDARDLKVQASATLGDLGPLAGRFLSLDDATIVLVGPRKAAEAALQASGLPPPEIRDVEGRVLAAKK